MGNNGYIDYEDLKNMNAEVFNLEGKDKTGPYYTFLRDYCENAIDFIDLLNEYENEADMGAMSLTKLPTAIGLFHYGNMEIGMTPENSLEHVKEQVTGYIFFSLYNANIGSGYKVSIELNEYGNSLDLLVSDGFDTERIDVAERIESAFDLISIEHEGDRMYVVYEINEFCDVLLGNIA